MNVGSVSWGANGDDLSFFYVEFGTGDLAPRVEDKEDAVKVVSETEVKDSVICE
jgi:hypothetical protein